MNCQFRPLQESDRVKVIDIFNYFVENGFAAYPDEKVPYGFFNMFLEISKGYPGIVVIDRDAADKVVGFAFMRAYNPFKTFKKCAELTYFLITQYTHKGIGKRIIDFFISEAKKININCLLAEVSSLNKSSIDFHQKVGFEQCGCFKQVGHKFGKDFDIIWMQKLL
jgi:phosphinothricin acetyltransferase